MTVVAQMDGGEANGWFHASQFESSGFDVNAYIEDASGNVSLQQMRKQLMQHIEALRAELIDVINADYSEFVSLSDQISTVDSAAIRLQGPLQQLKEALTAAQLRYSIELKSLKECLDRQSKMTSTKSVLEILQDAVTTMHKVESLALDLPPATIVPDPEACGVVSKQIERMSSEISRLRFCISNAAFVPLVGALDTGLQSVTTHLVAVVNNVLAVSLQRRTADAAAASVSCMHAALMLNRVQDAYAAVRAQVFRPALKAALDAAGGNRKGGGAGSADPGSTETGKSAPEFLAFLNAAKVELEAPLVWVLDVVARNSVLAASFDVLGAAALAELHEVMSENLPGAFSSANPDTFHQRFCAVTALLEWLCGHARSMAALRLFRDSAAHAGFVKSWTVAVYFSMRFQEIAGTFEEVLHAAPAAAGAAGKQRWAFKQTSALIQALDACTSPAVTFPAVYDKFFKLQLQLVLRFGAWVAEASVPPAAEAPGSRAPAAAAAGASPGAAGGADADFEGFHASSMRDWVQAAGLADVAGLVAEVWGLAEWLQGEWSQAVQAHLEKALPGPTLMVGVGEAIEHAAVKMLDSWRVLRHVLLVRVDTAAAGALRHVKSIGAMNRAGASRPSHYVRTLLKLPGELDQLPQWRQLPEEERNKFMNEAVANVTAAYSDVAKEVIATVSKTQASLSKLARVTTATNLVRGAGTTDSLLEFLNKQLLLDIEEFGRGISELLPAAELSSLQCYQQLLGLVGLEKRVGGAGAGEADAVPPVGKAPTS